MLDKHNRFIGENKMYEKIAVERSAYLSEILESSISYYLESYETEPLCIYMHPESYNQLVDEWGREPNNFMGVKIEISDEINVDSVFIV
jgi:hypothetical protein